MNEEVEQILDTVHIGAMATVNSDNTPLATPMHFARLDNSIIWISKADSRHVSNVKRTGRLEFVVWDEQRRAVYLNTTATVVAEPEYQRVMEAYSKKLGNHLPPVDNLEVFLSPIGQVDEKTTTQDMWHFIA